MIIQFLHPGKQYEIERGQANRGYRFFDGDQQSGILYWSSLDSHRRKYIRTSGNQINALGGPLLENQELVFWGEWEAHSVFTLIGGQNGGSEHPQHIHQPFISREHEGSQNTAPFVFGDCFVYSNCLQSFRTMRGLPDGSLIIFGSEIPVNGADSFVLDTVFVVQDSLPLDRGHLQNIQDRTSEVFKDAVLRKIDVNGHHRIYFSTTYGSGKREYYSYFPCRPHNAGVMLRPALPARKFDLKTPGSHQGIHIVQRGCLQYWRLLTDHLLNTGYSLGVKAHLPQRTNIRDTYGQHFA